MNYWIIPANPKRYRLADVVRELPFVDWRQQLIANTGRHILNLKKALSPILPDGTMLSMPIPSSGDMVKYKDIFHDGESYAGMIRQLKSTNPVINWLTESIFR